MLDGLKPYLPLPPPDARPRRVQVFTSYARSPVVLTVHPHPSNSLPESSIAPYLTQLQARVSAERIRIGSYPVLQRGVYVSLIGVDRERVAGIAAEVEKELQGKIVGEGEKGAQR